MTEVAASVWNEIARTQDLATEAATISFRLGPDQLADLETEWVKREVKRGTPERVASRLPTYYPLLAEASAIQTYLVENPALRSALPEILTPEDAAEIAAREWRLSLEEKGKLQALLRDPSTQELWLAASKSAQSKTSAGSPLR